MLIASAPVALPINTANPPTEAVANEAAQKTPVTEPPKTTENPNTRTSTDSNEQQRVNQEPAKEANQNRSEDESAADEQASREQERQEQRQQNQEKQEIEGLKLRDREVRAHEAAHAAVGGALAGAPQLTFKTGPDGKRYAIAGEVAIDISRAATPEATLAKMGQVERAALAPADPSGQDRVVAAKAARLANEASVEIREVAAEEAKLVQEERKAQATNDEQNPVTQEEAYTQEESNTQESQREQERRFFNPIAARRASLLLNQKIVNSGALDDPNSEPLLSRTA